MELKDASPNDYDQTQLGDMPSSFDADTLYCMDRAGAPKWNVPTAHVGRTVQPPGIRAAASPLSLAETRGLPARGGCRGAAGCVYRRDETFSSWGAGSTPAYCMSRSASRLPTLEFPWALRFEWTTTRGSRCGVVSNTGGGLWSGLLAVGRDGSGILQSALVIPAACLDAQRSGRLATALGEGGSLDRRSTRRLAFIGHLSWFDAG